MNAFARAEAQYLTPPDPREIPDTVEVVCPPNPDAECTHCGDPLESHLTFDPDMPPTLGDAACSMDAMAAFWGRRDMRQFELAEDSDLDCSSASICDVCQIALCDEHSDQFETCATGGLHHEECAHQCADCDAARYEDHLSDIGDAIRKGER